MKLTILFGYNYVDSTGFENSLVRVKSRIIFASSDERDEYVKRIREKFNPKNVPFDFSLKRKKLKLEAYEMQ